MTPSAKWNSTLQKLFHYPTVRSITTTRSPFIYGSISLKAASAASIDLGRFREVAKRCAKYCFSPELRKAMYSFVVRDIECVHRSKMEIIVLKWES